MTTIPTSRAWILCGLLFFETALSFLDRQVLSVLAPEITAEFGMSNSVYSRIVFAFVLSYTVMFSLGGRLMDAVGTKVGLALSVGLWSLASAAHSLAAGAWSLGAARFFLGVGEGACFPAATKGAVEWMPPHRRALAVGIANGGSAFGAVLAPPLSAWVATGFGWRWAFLATAVLGLLWLVAWYLAFRGCPASSEGTIRAKVSFVALLSRPEVRRLLFARFCFDPVFYFYMFWIPQYLARERNLSITEIGSLTWIPFLVLGLSNIAAGRASDMLVGRGWSPRRSRLAFMLLAALLTPASWMASLAATPGMAIALSSILMLAHGIWIANFITLIGDTVAPGEVGTAVGLSGTSGGIAGMISSLIVGPVADSCSFTPIFVVSAVLYPAAWMVIAAGRRLPLAIPAGGRMRVERRKPRTANVGLFGVGYHVYWHQFPGLLEELRCKLEVLHRKIAATGVFVQNFGIVDKAQDAYALVPRLKAADLDLIFCDMLTYATSASFAAIIRKKSRESSGRSGLMPMVCGS